MTLTKLSLLCLYHRLFPLRILRNISIAVAIVVLVYSLALVIMVFVHCTPLSKAWTVTDNGTCIDLRLPYVVTALSRSLQS
jgi:hypothetical protein